MDKKVTIIIDTTQATKAANELAESFQRVQQAFEELKLAMAAISVSSTLSQAEPTADWAEALAANKTAAEAYGYFKRRF